LISTHIMKYKRPQSLHCIAKRRHVSNNKDEMNCGRVKGENLHRHTNGYSVGNQTICWVLEGLVKGKNSLLRRKNIIIRFIFVYIYVSNQA